MILSYHAVGSGPWSTPEPIFREQIAWLAANARFRTVDEILAQMPSDDLQVAVTFDDGYESVLTVAAPVLERAHVSPMLFVSTSRIGDSGRAASDEAEGYYPGERFLCWSDVRALGDRGWAIGSHGHEHPDLARETAGNVADQMMKSKRIVEDRLETPCSVFAYPYGRSTPRVRAAAAACGYRRALGSTHGTVGRRVDPFNVPRIDVRNNYTLADFVAIMRGDWDYLRFVQTARHALHFYS